MLRQYLLSRAVIWAAGLLALAVIGLERSADSLGTLNATQPFGSEWANALLTPAARWDSEDYIEIATHGYADPNLRAFFPLYSLLIAAAGGGAASLALGIALTVLLALVGLLALYELVAIDFGPRVAAATVTIVVWLPASMVLSAVYTEALFLALSVGSILAARKDHWFAAGSLGMLAAASRSSGILVLIPLLIIYVFGPRGGPGGHPKHASEGRNPLRADVLWLGLVPLGLLAYMAYLGFAMDDPLGLFTAQSGWERSFAPLSAIPLAVWQAFQGAAQLIPGVGPDSPLAMSGPYGTAVGFRSWINLGILAVAIWLLLESYRRLPPAYTAYAAAGMALPLSVPASAEALKSFPRFLLVLFPLWIALALWATERRALRVVLAVSATLLVIFSALFTTVYQAP